MALGAGNKVRVLIVDDSALVRKILSEALSKDPQIEIVGTAPDPVVAQERIAKLKPDVLTLDLEMPRMDGLTFLRKLMAERPTPVVIISSLVKASQENAIEALRSGAVEVLAKPNGPYSVGDLVDHLCFKIRAAAHARVQRKPMPLGGASRPLALSKPAAPVVPGDDPALHCPEHSLFAIGASTGGTEAILNVMSRLPRNSPGIIVTQHIPAGFSKTFAERLHENCAMEVKEAVDGDLVGPGKALVAPGGFHMLLRWAGTGYRVAVKEGPLVCYQRPSVDVMFQSVVGVARGPVVAVLLTGMGSDGAQGMVALRKAGAQTIAQDEQSCVVFGMPKEAIRLGGAAQTLPLLKIPSAMVAALRNAPVLAGKAW
ncbi:MAG: chemotaxis response regulator protein-glutamate methylesterase [Bryobacterales bacterium]|nr:chemotaxis response regulator protein-glutamate methylesterase [Bryobacterales bacterium]